MHSSKNVLLRSWHLLGSAEKRTGPWIVFLMLFQSLLDFFSLAAFLPLIIFLIAPDESTTGHKIMSFLERAGLPNNTRSVIWLIVFIVVFFILKLFISFWITHRKASFAYKAGSDLATRAMDRYLQRSYQQFVNDDFTHEMNRIANLPISFCNNILIPVGTLMAELGVVLLLVAGIALYDIRAFLFLFLITLPTVIVYRLNRRNIRATGKKIKALYPRMLKYTLQAIEGLPEIKIFRKSAFFKTRFGNAHKDLGQTFARDYTLHAGTARITELIAALNICGLILYAVWNNQNPSQTILLLSLYAGVSFRAIPSVNRVFAAILQIRTHEFVVNDLYSMAPAGTSADEGNQRISFTRQLQLKNISFGYSPQHPVLHNISLTIRKGEKIGILGKSGSGKTTLFLILLRLLKEASGRLYVDDQLVMDEDAAAFRKLLGYVPQNPYILDASLLENIAFGVPPHAIDMRKIHDITQRLNLQEWIDALPDKMYTVIGEKGTRISGGQRQRIAIARALYHDCEIFLLDEVTNQLDRQTERDILRALDDLAAQHKTILFITHQPQVWRSFDAAYELENGQLKKIDLPTTQPSY